MFKVFLQLVLAVLLCSQSFAADWIADRLRGTVEQKRGGQWVELVRGTIIADGQSVRTGPDGRLDLVRGAEKVQLGSNTQILIHEGDGNVTSIVQASGELTAEVERRNVQHFSVQTPYLAAVVKGTIFRVVVGSGMAHVEVDRGTVQVQDRLNDLVVDIVRGQEAQVSTTAPLQVSGGGSVAVFTFEGQRVVNGTADVLADEQGSPETASQDPAGTSGGKGNGSGNANSSNGSGNGKFGNGNGKGNSGNGNGNGGGNGNGNAGNGNGNGGGNNKDD
jgi:FecR protein